MSLKEWVMIFIPAMVSIIGFLWTYYGIKRQLKNSMEQSVFEQKKNLYIESVVLMERFADDFRVLNKVEIQDKLYRIIAELDLFGKQDVVDTFRQFASDIYDYNEEYELCIAEKSYSVNTEKSFQDMQERNMQKMQNSINLIIELMRKDMNIK